MRILLLAGASTLALATPALAQTSEPAPTDQSDDSGLDTLVPADETPTAEAPKPTGDPVLDRLNALEARISQLETENAQLREQGELNEGRLETVEARAAKNAQFGWAPTISDPAGDFTFKPRGVIEADAGVFSEREGGYKYSDGTQLRRARLGFEGTAFKWFNYRAEVDFAGNAVNITDLYLQYTKIPKTVITIGQHKAPLGLESNNSDNYNTFLERGMFTNAFGNAGAERRIGVSAAYAPKENINIAGGLFGDNESISRGSGAAPGESWGVNGRATWEPVFDTGKIIHLGISGYYRDRLKSGDTPDAARLNDRPNIRIDGGNIADSGVITNTHSLRYAGVEAAGVFGSLTVAGEAGRLWLDRFNASNEHFTGYYGYASYFLTGETRPLKGGNFDRVRPFKDVGNGGLGAFEVALRYDHIDLSNTPVLARADNEASSITAGLNWYFNPYAKLMFNWVRFDGDNTPLDPIGSKTKGDAFATRLHLDF
jgi:phosphate-selective porin OprO/OprP